MSSTMMSAIRGTYARTVMIIAAEPLASSALILTLLLPALLIERYYYWMRSTKNNKRPRCGTKTETSSTPSEIYPLWISLLLLFSPAIEFPFMFSLHPVTLAYPAPTANVPTLVQLALQVGGFFAIQFLFTHYVLRSISISTAEQNGLMTVKAVELCLPESDPDDKKLTDIVMDFVRPRGTLLLGIAAMGFPLKATRFLGSLHPLAMVAWLVLDHLYFIVNRCK